MTELQNTPTPHIGAKQGEIAETILLPGDPLRAKYIAEHFLTDAKQFNTTRNMYGYTGYYQGKRVSVMGTGMGCPSMGIYSYELIHFYGCKNLIRIGTAGALRPEVKVRELIFAMGSCTTSNYVKQFRLPGDYSCVCSYELLEKAVESAKKRNLKYHVGNILCSDMFYNPPLEPTGTTWAQMGVLAVEMESAALYSNAAYAGANAICILTVSDSAVTGEATTAEEREKTFTNMMEVALDTGVRAKLVKVEFEGYCLWVGTFGTESAVRKRGGSRNLPYLNAKPRQIPLLDTYACTVTFEEKTGENNDRNCSTGVENRSSGVL